MNQIKFLIKIMKGRKRMENKNRKRQQEQQIENSNRHGRQ